MDAYMYVHMNVCMHPYVNTYFVYDKIYILKKSLIFPNIIRSFVYL